MTRDEGLRVTHRQPSPHATCCWCGTALGERRTAPHREVGPLVFCSGRCSAEHEAAVLRLERLRPAPSPEGATNAAKPADAFDWDDALVLPRSATAAAVGWP